MRDLGSIEAEVPWRRRYKTGGEKKIKENFSFLLELLQVSLRGTAGHLCQWMPKWISGA